MSRLRERDFNTARNGGGRGLRMDEHRHQQDRGACKRLNKCIYWSTEHCVERRARTEERGRKMFRETGAGGGGVHKRAYRVFFNGCYHRASSKMMKRRTVYGLLRNHLSSCVCLLSSLFWINLTVLAAAESPLYIRDNIWNSKCLILHIGRPKQASHSYWATDLWHLCL